MTPTHEQIVQWQIAANAHARDRVDYSRCPGKWEDVRDAHFAMLVRNAALDEAAKICDETPPEPFRPSIEAAHAIRKVKTS